jgi:uncharacterized protein YegP (UPF0339 family)
VPAKFTLTKDKAGSFRFTVVAPNGQIIATSQGYATKASALNGVMSLRKNATTATLTDLTAPAPATKPATVAKPIKAKASRTVRSATAKKPTERRGAKAATSRTVTRKAATKPVQKPSARKTATTKTAPTPARRAVKAGR